MLKKCKVVMLPTNEKAKKGELYFFDKLLISEGKYAGEISQHLYFLSDEEIKEGEYYYNVVRKDVQQCENNIEASSLKHSPQYAKKIIATTDSSLKITIDLGEIARENILPQPSQSFLEVFVKEYNKGNVIKEVLVDLPIQKTDW